MHYYPIFVDLKGKSCLVVGAGQVGKRKITTLLGCGVDRLLVVDPAPPGEDMGPLLDHPSLKYAQRGFDPKDLEGMFLVIASTDKAELNRNISRMCQERNLLCNIVDQPELCNFILPSILTRGDLTVAVSTSGSSPALARKIRQRLGDTIGPEYADTLALMRRLRPLVIGQGGSQETNASVFRSLIDDQILQAVKNRDHSLLKTLLRQRLPESVHPQMEGLVDELSHSG